MVKIKQEIDITRSQVVDTHSVEMLNTAFMLFLQNIAYEFKAVNPKMLTGAAFVSSRGKGGVRGGIREYGLDVAMRFRLL